MTPTPPVSRTRRREHYVRALIDALNHPEPATPVRAAWILGELRAHDAAPALIRCAVQHDDDPELLSAIAEALGKMAEPSLVPFLAELAAISFLKVRLTSVEALAQFSDIEVARSALRRATLDPNAIVRAAAQAALEESDGRPAPRSNEAHSRH